MQVRRRALHEQKSQSKYFGSVLLDINDTKYETASIQQVARYNKNSAKGGFIVSSPFFMFAQRGWQTRQVARDLYHPD